MSTEQMKLLQNVVFYKKIVWQTISILHMAAFLEDKIQNNVKVMVRLQDNQ